MSASSNLSSEKYWALKRFLQEEYLLVHINTSTEGLSIPSHLTQDASVTLKLSQYFRGTMNIDQNEIVAELLFAGDYTTCTIPLDAIWGCHSAKGNTSLWPESAPEEILQSILASAVTETTDSNEAEDEEESLRAIDSETAKDDAGEEEGKSLPRKGHLRRIK